MKQASIFLPLLLGVAACGQPAQSNAADDSPAVAETATTAPPMVNQEEAASSEGPAPVADAGAARWESGMQMGQFWAAVTNAKGDALRFTSDEKDGNAVNWKPSFEAKDRGRIGTASGTATLTVGEKSASMPYQIRDGGIEATGPAEDVRKLIMEAAGQPVCLAIAATGYRTCFSTAAASEALK